MRRLFATSLGLALLVDETVLAQSYQRAAFVANNGNLEGAVTSFLIGEDGRPVFVQKLVIESRPAGAPAVPGTNAYAIDISPNGRFIATTHATALDPEQVTVIEVNSDATMAVVETAVTPNSPLDLRWVTDTLLVVAHTDLGATNEVVAFSFDPESAVLTEVDRGATGSFTSALDVHPNRRFVYAGDSNSFFIRVFEVSPAGELTAIQTYSTGTTYPLNLEVSPDGSRLYAGGGISGDDHRILGCFIDANGMLSEIPGSPFFSSGVAPNKSTFSPDGSLLFVAHGTDGTCRSFAIDAENGALTETGFLFDFGIQGSIGDVQTLGEFLLGTDSFSAIDNRTGLFTFNILPTGEFTETGPIVGTEATAPTQIAVWDPPQPNCPADLDGDGSIGLTDLAILLTNFGLPGGATPQQGDTDRDGDVDLVDLATLLTVFGSDCD